MPKIQFGPFGGFNGGYNDPLSQNRGPLGGGPSFGSTLAYGPGLPGAGQMPQIPGMGGKPYAPGGGAPASGGRRSIGSYLTGALDWLTDEESGANRQNLLMGGLGMGLQYMGARDDRKEDRRQTARQEEFEDERRANMEAMRPIMTPLLVEMLRKRQQGGG